MKYPDAHVGAAGPTTPEMQSLNAKWIRLEQTRKKMREEINRLFPLESDDAIAQFDNPEHKRMRTEMRTIIAEQEQISRRYHDIKDEQTRGAEGNVRQSPFVGLNRDQFPPAKKKPKIGGAAETAKQKLDEELRGFKEDEEAKKAGKDKLNESLEMLKGKFGSSSRK